MATKQNTGHASEAIATASETRDQLAPLHAECMSLGQALIAVAAQRDELVEALQDILDAQFRNGITQGQYDRACALLASIQAAVAKP